MSGENKSIFSVDPDNWNMTEDITMSTLVGLSMYFWSGVFVGVRYTTIVALSSIILTIILFKLRRGGYISTEKGELILKSGAVALGVAVIGGFAYGVVGMALDVV